MENILRGVGGPSRPGERASSPSMVRSNQSILFSPASASTASLEVSIGDGGGSRMLGVHNIRLCRSSIKVNGPPGSTPRRGAPVVLSRKSSSRPALLRWCFSSAGSGRVGSPACTEGADCGASRPGNAGGGSNRWGGEGGGEKVEEFRCRWSRGGSGLRVVDVSKRKTDGCHF